MIADCNCVSPVSEFQTERYGKNRRVFTTNGSKSVQPGKGSKCRCTSCGRECQRADLTNLDD